MRYALNFTIKQTDLVASVRGWLFGAPDPPPPGCARLRLHTPVATCLATWLFRRPCSVFARARISRIRIYVCAHERARAQTGRSGGHHPVSGRRWIATCSYLKKKEKVFKTGTPCAQKDLTLPCQQQKSVTDEGEALRKMGETTCIF